MGNLPESIPPPLKLPESFKKMIEFLGFFNLNLFEIIPMGCLTGGTFNYYSMAVGMTLLPLVIVGLVLVIGMRRGEEKKHGAFTIALAVLYLVLPMVSVTIFALFPCDRVSATERYLRADYSIECTGGSRIGSLCYGGVMVLLYPIGIPSLFGLLLWRKKDRIMSKDREEDGELQGIAFLYEAYKEEYWWFEVWETTRRLALTGGLSLIKPGGEGQLVAGMLLSFAGALGQCFFWPYKSDRDKVLATLANVQIFLVMMVASVLRGEGGGEEVGEEGLGGLLIALTVLNVLVFLFWGWVAAFQAAKEEDATGAEGHLGVAGAEEEERREGYGGGYGVREEEEHNTVWGGSEGGGGGNRDERKSDDEGEEEGGGGGAGQGGGGGGGGGGRGEGGDGRGQEMERTLERGE